MGGSNPITFEKKLVLNNDPEKSYLKSSFWREIQNLNFLYGTTNFARSPNVVLKRYFIPTLVLLKSKYRVFKMKISEFKSQYV